METVLIIVLILVVYGIVFWRDIYKNVKKIRQLEHEVAIRRKWMNTKCMGLYETADIILLNSDKTFIGQTWEKIL